MTPARSGIGAVHANFRASQRNAACHQMRQHYAHVSALPKPASAHSQRAAAAATLTVAPPLASPALIPVRVARAGSGRRSPNYRSMVPELTERGLYETELERGIDTIGVMEAPNGQEEKQAPVTMPPRGEPADALYRAIAKTHIPMDSLEECSAETGHPRQAWAHMLQPGREPTPCPVCQKTPDFPSWCGTLSVRGFDEDVVDEEVGDLFIEHAIVESIEDGNLFFRFESRREM